MMNERQLLEVRHQIDDAKQRVAELKGRQGHQLETLQKDWKCSSVEEAKQLQDSILKKIGSLNIKIDKALQELENKYPL